MKRLLYGGMILTGIFVAGMWWEGHTLSAPPEYTETERSPIIIGELLKRLKLETGTRSFETRFDLEHDQELKVLGLHAVSIPLEWGTYDAIGKASAGFDQGAIHVLKLEPTRIEFQFDAPALLHLETDVKVVSHSSVWSDIHFQDEATERGKAKLRSAVCSSTLLNDASTSVKEELEQIVHEEHPDVQVIVHLTAAKAC